MIGRKSHNATFVANDMRKSNDRAFSRFSFSWLIVGTDASTRQPESPDLTGKGASLTRRDVRVGTMASALPLRTSIPCSSLSSISPFYCLISCLSFGIPKSVDSSHQQHQRRDPSSKAARFSSWRGSFGRVRIEKVQEFWYLLTQVGMTPER